MNDNNIECLPVIAPLISVILVSMNRKDLLEKCLKSVRKQVYQEREIVVVDNGSTDGTAEMVMLKFPEVRYFHFNINAGAVVARNYGVRKCRGEFCVFMDDDAFFFEDDALNRVASYFQGDNRLGCIAFRIVNSMATVEEYKSIPRLDKKTIQADYECSYFCGAGFACRRDIFLELGLFWSPLFFYVEELDFSYRLINKGYSIIRSATVSVMHEETFQARVRGEWLYYYARNRCWVALRHLPWFNVLTHTLLWWGYLALTALRERHLKFYIHGVRDALAGISKAMKTRTCISREAMEKIKELDGRVYY